MNLIQHIRRQREWALRTFGPKWDPQGNIEHIRRELIEIEADPFDLSEWVDVVILALQGAFRAGHSPAEIANAITTKQIINESRQWPDWRTADHSKPIEHVREPAERPEKRWLVDPPGGWANGTKLAFHIRERAEAYAATCPPRTRIIDRHAIG